MKHIADILSADGGVNDYIVVEVYPDINYAIVRRNATYEPWIAAYGVDWLHHSWQQGHYFATLREAVAWINTKFEEADDENNEASI